MKPIVRTNQVFEAHLWVRSGTRKKTINLIEFIFSTLLLFVLLNLDGIIGI